MPQLPVIVKDPEKNKSELISAHRTSQQANLTQQVVQQTQFLSQALPDGPAVAASVLPGKQFSRKGSHSRSSLHYSQILPVKAEPMKLLVVPQININVFQAP